ncbi:hypothetical protein JX265_011214 [Neoarthrinium moseri]|uniref:Uncharacterized protein n=1 Tax=Neoarthrinium moseri TaxID=1658444 RepID=A0A9P9WCV0_9PEZI|nr:uncharacterized protein JN550_010520 [Neoarthrinium moseri]KAI1845890.1 hypothetical protein JX266_007977 [Neoarthrinium moseri]KAI1857479.1 hypothetical protein JX265_011214 [Neoarthrinium moseri]KAI1862055.1 hypothetical protein JN550_010520 [Neoarthrinium moseri]
MPNSSYYARRYRTLFSPEALNFSTHQPRPAIAAVYSPAPSGIHCGLPKAAAASRNPRVLLTFFLPIVLATGIVTYLEGKTEPNVAFNDRAATQDTITHEAARRKALADAYGDRESLDRLAEVMAIYEATR